MAALGESRKRRWTSLRRYTTARSNLTNGWSWDGGVNVVLADEMNGIVADGNLRRCRRSSLGCRTPYARTSRIPITRRASRPASHCHKGL